MAEIQYGAGYVAKDDEIAIPAAITEDIFHYAVHEGLAFDTSTYHASTDQYICFKTPNEETYLHLLFTLPSEGNTRLFVYRGVTAGVGGADQVVYNKNHALGTASKVIAGNSATVGSVQVGQAFSGGTLINPQGYYSAKNSATINASHELLLAKNTLYGFHNDPIDSKDSGMTLTWFEVPAA